MSEYLDDTEKVKIVIPSEVSKIMSKWGGHSVRLAAARGALPMSGPNLVMVLFVFYHGDHQELREEALCTLETLPAQILLAALSQAELHPSIIDFIVKLRYRDTVVMQAALRHRMIGIKSLLFLAEKVVVMSCTCFLITMKLCEKQMSYVPLSSLMLALTER